MTSNENDPFVCSFLTHSLRSNGRVFVERGKTALAGVSRNLRRRM